MKRVSSHASTAKVRSKVSADKETPERGSWFIQHWPHPTDWDNEENIRLQTQLFERGQVAVHYQDIASADPNDYNEYSQKYIKKFVKLAKHGGYICANFPPIKRMLIGRVRPNSKILFDHKPPIFKRLTLSEWKPVAPDMRVRFLVGAPMRATLSQVKVIRQRLITMVEGRKVKRAWELLLPCEQETICQEYMRKKFKMAYLLLPFGRTLEDVDIAGISANGDRIFAQVKYDGTRRQLTEAATKLLAYPGQRLFFCSRPHYADEFQESFHDAITFVWTQDVWDWVQSESAYSRKLFTFL